VVVVVVVVGGGAERLWGIIWGGFGYFEGLLGSP